MGWNTGIVAWNTGVVAWSESSEDGPFVTCHFWFFDFRLRFSFGQSWSWVNCSDDGEENNLQLKRKIIFINKFWVIFFLHNFSNFFDLTLKSNWFENQIGNSRNYLPISCSWWTSLFNNGFDLTATALYINYFLWVPNHKRVGFFVSCAYAFECHCWIYAVSFDRFLPFERYHS